MDHLSGSDGHQSSSGAMLLQDLAEKMRFGEAGCVDLRLASLQG